MFFYICDMNILILQKVELEAIRKRLRTSTKVVICHSFTFYVIDSLEL